MNSRASTIAYTLHGNCYLNITSHCTLRCGFCPKFNGSWEVQHYELRLYEEPSADDIVAAAGDPSRYNEIVFCGLGEPTRRLDVMLEVAERLHNEGARIRVNTDGLANLIHARDVTPEFAGLIDAVSISMNAHNEPTYNRHCRPRQPQAFSAMLAFSRSVSEYVPEVVMTAIDGLPGVDISACQEIADEIGVTFRRRVLDKVG
ncbi:MAG TPA: radical SAM protein [Gammaproteobacteria bacterium]|nr:radical SAM protein [Gammaproteobacteria bacterium]